MTGETQFKSAMDTLLDDKIYYSLYSFIERCNRFFDTKQSMTHNFLEDDMNGVSFDIFQESMYITKYRSDLPALSLLYDENSHLNSMTPDCVILLSNAKHTDITVLNTIQPSSKYDEFGWFIKDHIINENMESDIFQWSTVESVYSIGEIQELLNRARNLPFGENQCLTIHTNFMYHRYHSVLDKLLIGY